MRYILAVLGFYSVFSFCPTYAQAFDPNRCASIEDVDLPFDVRRADGAMTFSGRAGDIVVTAQSIRVNGRTHASAAVGTYCQTLSIFLTQAETTARAMNPMASERADMSEASTGMCRAILELAASSAVIETEFAGFASPVRIRLR